METIKSYLDNMFANLPKTDQIVKLRNDLLASMEDKYNELKGSGKTENEAIGIVISEFGNIDELLKELGIEISGEEEKKPVLSEVEVKEYLKISKKNGNIIGIGVVLCIAAPAVLILINQLIEDGFIGGIRSEVGNIFGLIPLFILIAIAVGMFIYTGMISEKYKYIEGDFVLPDYVRASIQKNNDAFIPSYTLSVIIGVVMCILSPVALFITAAASEALAPYGVIVLLAVVAAAVYIFIYFGTTREAYKKLLKIDEYSKPLKVRKQADRVISAVAAVVWPLAACIFLVSGLVYNQWHINWVVFPVTGLLFAMFSGAYSIIKEKER